MNKFKRDQQVRFKGNDEIYRIIRHYETDTGWKYDVITLNGRTVVLAMPENVLQSIYMEITEIMVDPEAANLPKYQKNEQFPEGMEDELVRLGKKKDKK